MSTKRQQIDKLLQAIDETMETVTKEEFTQAFDAVITSFGFLKKDMLAELEAIKAKADKKLESIKEMSTSDFVKVQKEYMGKIEKALREQENGMNFIYDKVKQIRDGKDADEQRIVDRVIEEIIIPEPQIIDVPSIIEPLEKEIQKLKDKIAQLEQKPSRLGGGGGTSDSSVSFSLSRIVKTEVPSGAIDGNNTTYKVNGTIKAILSFAINGQVIHSNEYSVSGKTITFTTALPAELSGTRFEIVYC